LRLPPRADIEAAYVCLLAYSPLGTHKPECWCCGDDDDDCLKVQHQLRDGWAHREAVRIAHGWRTQQTGVPFYRALNRDGNPPYEGMVTMCGSCSDAWDKRGRCRCLGSPHKAQLQAWTDRALGR